MNFPTASAPTPAPSTPRPVFAGHQPARFEPQPGSPAVLPKPIEPRLRRANRLRKRIGR